MNGGDLPQQARVPLPRPRAPRTRLAAVRCLEEAERFVLVEERHREVRFGVVVRPPQDEVPDVRVRMLADDRLRRLASAHQLVLPDEAERPQLLGCTGRARIGDGEVLRGLGRPAERGAGESRTDGHREHSDRRDVLHRRRLARARRSSWGPS